MFQFSHREIGTILVVEVRGEMRFEKECGELEASLAVVTAGRTRCILLDLSHATDLSSAGLSVILEAMSTHVQRGGVFKICGVRPPPWPKPSRISPDTIHLPVADALGTFSVDDCSPLPEP